MAFPKLENCQLCGSYAPLQRSHIVPAFVYRRVFGKHARYFGALHPRRLQQHGESVHMMCRECEALFSGLERYFQRAIWPPKGIVSLPIFYNDTFYKFACSVSWRVLMYLQLSSPDTYVEPTTISKLLGSQVSEAQHSMCNAALTRWSAFLLAGELHKRDQHVVFLNGANVPHERADTVGFAMFNDAANLAVVAILGPLMVIGFIARGPGWYGTRINPIGSAFPVLRQHVPATFVSWLQELYGGLQEIAY